MNTKLRERMGLNGLWQLALLLVFVLSLALMSCGKQEEKKESDTTIPSNTTASNFINSGASSTSSTSVTLSISATDSVGVTGYYASEASTTPSASATGWTSITSATSYSASVSFTLSSGDGTKTVYVWFKDAAGNVSASVSDSITLATTLASKLVGTWGETTLDHNNGGTWSTEICKFTYNSNNTGASTCQWNNGGTLETGAPDTFTYSAVSNPDGSLTTTKTFASDGAIRTHRWVIGDDGNVMILDGTTNSNKQRLRVAVKLDTAKTYTNADLIGDYYMERYTYNGSYNAGAGLTTFDGVGNKSSTSTTNTNGTITTSTVSGTYSVTSDGSYTLDNGPTGYLSGDGKFGVNAHVTFPDAWSLALSMKKGDKTYSTADLAGTWAYSTFGDNGGASFRAVIGTMTCNSSGSCPYSEKIQADGSISYQSGTENFSVASNGSITDVNNPSKISAIGNNGNAIIVNNSFDTNNPGKRRIRINIKCSACTDLAPVPQYTASGTYTWNSTTGIQTSNWASSNFTCSGPSAGSATTKTGVIITSTTMTYDGGDIWTRSISGAASDIVGTWTFTNSTTGNSYTMTYNADGTVSLVGNIVSCGSAGTSFIKNPTNGHSYKLTDLLGWSEAENQAIQLGGHLVTINNREEELWLRGQFGTNAYLWIGFNDIGSEGNWQWASGEAASYTNWWTGEPNNHGGDGIEEDAAIMNWATPGPYGDGWNDLPVGGGLQGIVEIAGP